MSAWGYVTIPTRQARRNELAQALADNIGAAMRASKS